MVVILTGILLSLSALSQAPAFRVQTLAGSNFAGDGGPAVKALLLQPEGIAAAPDGTIYIADAAGHRIREVAPDGTIRTVAGTGSPGFSGDGGPGATATLNSPYGLALDRHGNLYIADLGNARIRVLSANGHIRTAAGGGMIPASDSSEGSPATALQLKAPRNILADTNGGFYFSDFDAHRVYYVDRQGVLTVFAGTGTPGYGADNLPAVRSALRNPAGLTFEPMGGVIIVESGSQRLRRVARGVVTNYLADSLRNYPLFSPTGAAFDASGNLYIADARATGALKRSPQGDITTLPVSGRAVAADPRGGALYTGNGAVHRVTPANSAVLIAGAAALDALLGDGGNAESARIPAPAALAYDRGGNLYIADEAAHRVRRVTPAGLITTVAGNGVPAFAGDRGPAVQASLQAPRGVAVDDDGFLYIADSGNHCIRVVAPNGIITTLAGNGFAGFRGDGGAASSAQFHTPSGIALHPGGDLFIADTANHRVRRLSRGGVITTFAGTGLAGLAADSGPATLAQLNEPRGLVFDGAGNLYIADTGNNRIRRVDPTGFLDTPGASDFSAPQGVAVAIDGSVLVADTGNHRIVQLAGGSATTVAGTGEPGYAGDGGYGNEARFQFPTALAIDASGNVAVADRANGRIRLLRPEAVLISVLQNDAGVVHAATGAAGRVAPGMLATLHGEAFGPAEPASATTGAAGWPLRLGDVEVHVNGQPAGLLYVSARQINLQIPVATTGPEARIEIFHRRTLRAGAKAEVSPTVPGLFPQIVHPDASINSPTNAIARGGIVLLFATGVESVAPAAITVSIGAQSASILWAGPAPGLPGLTQINVQLPAGFFPSGRHEVTLRAAGVTAPAGTVVNLQ
jgi:uncharacterized protein (TIGR03437 family)